MLSIDSVHDMFIERAKAIQPYDVGPGGRFWLQQLALGTILENPNGLGPFEFARIFGPSSTTSICRPFWSMAGSAAPPI